MKVTRRAATFGMVAAPFSARGNSVNYYSSDAVSARCLVFLFDGTWFGPYQSYPSHVMRLATLVHSSIDRTKAISIHYYHGVGSGSGTGALSKFIDRWGGGAFGSGYKDLVAEAYLDVALNYRPGDSVFLLGWSRGAFVARQLVNLLRTIGLADSSHFAKLPKLIDDVLSRRAAGPESHPDGSYYLNLRAQLSEGISIGVGSDLEFRRAKNLPVVDVFRINYLGLWDCVSAIGPTRRFAYNDASLTRMVENSRHAVAADERRSAFPIDLWDNLELLNSIEGETLHEQKAFPGDHGVVGGGTKESLGLSLSNFVWVLDGAINSGLPVQQAELEHLRAQIDLTLPVGAPPAGINRLFTLVQSSRNLARLELSEDFRRRQNLVPSYWPDL